MKSIPLRFSNVVWDIRATPLKSKQTRHSEQSEASQTKQVQGCTSPKPSPQGEGVVVPSPWGEG